MDSWYLRLVWDTHESDLLKVVGIPDDWDGDATQALITGLQGEPVLIAINGELQDRDDSYFAVTVRMEGNRVGFGFMARTAEVLPPSEQDAEMTTPQVELDRRSWQTHHELVQAIFKYTEQSGRSVRCVRC